MSLHRCGIGFGAVLVIALLVDVPAAADEKQPGYLTADGKRVATRGERLAPGTVIALPGASREPGRWQGGGQPERNDTRVRSEPRVVVRDLRDDRDRPYSRYGRRHDNDRRGWCWSLPPSALSYSPYGFGYRHDPYPLRHRLLDLYRAQRYIEQKERERRFNRRDMAKRKQRLLDKHEQALDAGLQRLKEGEPARAIVAFTLAARLNQGDPACRIHLAQARLAQGHYLEAALALRRALQLQPKLVYADLHLREHYDAADALDKYSGVLANWVRENRARPEVHFLLGFLEFQRGHFEAAHAAFTRVAKAMPKDDLTRDYLEITKPPAK